MKIAILAQFPSKFSAIFQEKMHNFAIFYCNFLVTTKTTCMHYKYKIVVSVMAKVLLFVEVSDYTIWHWLKPSSVPSSISI